MGRREVSSDHAPSSGDGWPPEGASAALAVTPTKRRLARHAAVRAVIRIAIG
jgi:hypothetical protein